MVIKGSNSGEIISVKNGDPVFAGMGNDDGIELFAAVGDREWSLAVLEKTSPSIVI